MTSHTKPRGFTLLEMLLVIAIIAILAAIVIVAINPARQLAQARNAQRASDLNAIYKAVQQYYIDNQSYPDTISGTLTDICESGADPDFSCPDGTIDLSDLVPTYLDTIPGNPSTDDPYQLALNNTQLALIAPGSKEEGLDGVAVGTSTDAIAGGDEGGGGSCDATCQALRVGLVGYWPFEGNSNDYGGSVPNDGTILLGLAPKRLRLAALVREYYLIQANTYL